MFTFRTKKAQQLHALLMKGITENGNYVGCSQSPDDWFASGINGYQDSYQHLQIAKDICNMCPLKTLCMAYAIEEREPYGVYGGTTPGERRKIREALNAKKPPRR